MQLALYEPDIAQNTGAILRLAACLDVPVHIIEPAGFDASDKTLRRAGLDYIEHARIDRHVSFGAFEMWRAAQGKRLILLTTRSDVPYTAVSYREGDILLLGRESAGVPDGVRAVADERVRVPLAEGRRSLNVVTAAAMVLGEALRQTGGFPEGS